MFKVKGIGDEWRNHRLCKLGSRDGVQEERSVLTERNWNLTFPDTGYKPDVVEPANERAQACQKKNFTAALEHFWLSASPRWLIRRILQNHESLSHLL